MLKILNFDSNIIFCKEAFSSVLSQNAQIWHMACCIAQDLRKSIRVQGLQIIGAWLIVCSRLLQDNEHSGPKADCSQDCHGDAIRFEKEWQCMDRPPGL